MWDSLHYNSLLPCIISHSIRSHAHLVQHTRAMSSSWNFAKLMFDTPFNIASVRQSVFLQFVVSFLCHSWSLKYSVFPAKEKLRNKSKILYFLHSRLASGHIVNDWRSQNIKNDRLQLCLMFLRSYVIRIRGSFVVNRK